LLLASHYVVIINFLIPTSFLDIQAGENNFFILFAIRNEPLSMHLNLKNVMHGGT